MSKSIPLTQGKITLVDDEDYEYLNQWKWHYHGGYAMRTTNKPWSKVMMHRVIMQTPEGMNTDHVDGDKLNNQRRNLRVCTHQENSRNVKRHSDNTSGYKGVTWHKKVKKWNAKIGKFGKRLHLGYFDNPIDAAIAYDKKASELYGEFASLNFPK